MAPGAPEKATNRVQARILIADDHELVRAGLRALIESHAEWNVCGEAVSGREAVKRAQKLKPDLVVMDISMPDLNGLEATRQILRDVPGTEVLVFTMDQSEQAAGAARAAGAQAYVSKTATGRELAKAIAAMIQHKPFSAEGFQIPAPEGYGKNFPQGKSAGRQGALITAREREVLNLLAAGKSSKQIAATLRVSLKTVEAHRANMMRKLDIHSLATLVRYAIRNGIVTDQ